MPKEMRNQLIGYGPDMAKRIAHAKELLASYEKDKGKIDWSKLKVQCATTIKRLSGNMGWHKSRFVE